MTRKTKPKVKPHTHGPDDIPEFLCRLCHPELNLTPERRAELDAEDAVKRKEANAIDRKKWALAKASIELRQIEKRNPDPDSTPGKIAKSLERKIARLQRELENA